MTAPILSVRELRKSYTVRRGRRRERFDAVAGASFEIGRGEAVALVGGSGSGKSTLARIVVGSERADSGQVVVDGVDVGRGRPSLAYRRRVQMILQDPFGSLNPTRTLGYHIERPLLRHRIARTRADARLAARSLLERVGLAPGDEIADKYPHECSGGQRQRVAIARALAVSPELLLADEPTSMLDVSLRGDILQLLRDLRTERGISLLYITHDLAAARHIADRVLVMHQGCIVESGPAGEVLSAPRHDYTRQLLAALPRLSG